MGAGCYYLSIEVVLAVLSFKIYINHQFLSIRKGSKKMGYPAPCHADTVYF